MKATRVTTLTCLIALALNTVGATAGFPDRYGDYYSRYSPQTYQPNYASNPSNGFFENSAIRKHFQNMWGRQQDYEPQIYNHDRYQLPLPNHDRYLPLARDRGINEEITPLETQTAVDAQKISTGQNEVDGEYIPITPTAIKGNIETIKDPFVPMNDFSSNQARLTETPNQQKQIDQEQSNLVALHEDMLMTQPQTNEPQTRHKREYNSNQNDESDTKETEEQISTTANKSETREDTIKYNQEIKEEEIDEIEIKTKKEEESEINTNHGIGKRKIHKVTKEVIKKQSLLDSFEDIENSKKKVPSSSNNRHLDLNKAFEEARNYYNGDKFRTSEDYKDYISDYLAPLLVKKFEDGLDDESANINNDANNQKSHLHEKQLKHNVESSKQPETDQSETKDRYRKFKINPFYDDVDDKEELLDHKASEMPRHKIKTSIEYNTDEDDSYDEDEYKNDDHNVTSLDTLNNQTSVTSETTTGAPKDQSSIFISKSSTETMQNKFIPLEQSSNKPDSTESAQEATTEAVLFVDLDPTTTQDYHSTVASMTQPNQRTDSEIKTYELVQQSSTDQPTSISSASTEFITEPTQSPTITAVQPQSKQLSTEITQSSTKSTEANIHESTQTIIIDNDQSGLPLTDKTQSNYALNEHSATEQSFSKAAQSTDIPVYQFSTEQSLYVSITPSDVSSEKPIGKEPFSEPTQTIEPITGQMSTTSHELSPSEAFVPTAPVPFNQTSSEQYVFPNSTSSEQAYHNESQSTYDSINTTPEQAVQPASLQPDGPTQTSAASDKQFLSEQMHPESKLSDVPTKTTSEPVKQPSFSQQDELLTDPTQTTTTPDKNYFSDQPYPESQLSNEPIQTTSEIDKPLSSIHPGELSNDPTQTTNTPDKQTLSDRLYSEQPSSQPVITTSEPAEQSFSAQQGEVSNDPTQSTTIPDIQPFSDEPYPESQTPNGPIKTTSEPVEQLSSGHRDELSKDPTQSTTIEDNQPLSEQPYPESQTSNDAIATTSGSVEQPSSAQWDEVSSDPTQNTSTPDNQPPSDQPNSESQPSNEPIQTTSEPVKQASSIQQEESSYDPIQNTSSPDYQPYSESQPSNEPIKTTSEPVEQQSSVQHDDLSNDPTQSTSSPDNQTVSDEPYPESQTPNGPIKTTSELDEPSSSMHPGELYNDPMQTTVVPDKQSLSEQQYILTQSSTGATQISTIQTDQQNSITEPTQMEPLPHDGFSTEQSIQLSTIVTREMISSNEDHLIKQYTESQFSTENTQTTPIPVDKFASAQSTTEAANIEATEKSDKTEGTDQPLQESTSTLNLVESTTLAVQSSTDQQSPISTESTQINSEPVSHEPSQQEPLESHQATVASTDTSSIHEPNPKQGPPTTLEQFTTESSSKETVGQKSRELDEQNKETTEVTTHSTSQDLELQSKYKRPQDLSVFVQESTTNTQTRTTDNERRGRYDLSKTNERQEIVKAVESNINFKTLIVPDKSKPGGRCYCSCEMNSKPVFISLDASKINEFS